MATKKISELPLITALSGSQQETLIPVVVGGLNGTTNRITAENFSKFVNAYNATTSSNTFIGAQIINGNLTVTGNQVISGRLTVNELVAQYETASIIFSSGSNKFGDELTDKQEFTGSLDLVGNFILNGAQINNTLDKVHQATGSLQIFTASQDSRNFVISQYTSSTDAHIVGISDFTSSQLIVNTGLASVTASLNNFSGSTNAFTGSIEKTTASIHLATASLNYFYQSTSSLNGFTASQADRNLNLSIVTGSLNIFTASQDDRNFVISQYTASTDAHIVGISQFTSSILSQNAGVASVTASLNAFTASQDSRNFVISQFTSSTNAHIVGISDFTSSQLAVNLGNSIYTASVDSHIVGISTYTSSVRDTLARIHQSTASLQQFTASQDSRNLTLSTVTGSLIGITNELMAFTAALDSTYATDAQLYQLYQATQSLELHSGSMVGVTNGLMAFSSSQLAVNLTLSTVTGSLIGITNGLMAFTAALDNTYATDAQLYQLYQATQSLELHSGSMIGITNALMAFTAALDSTYATDAQLYQLYAETASIKAEIAGIEAYTASLKGAAIVSSSQQITNYYKFAETASANTFYGNQTINDGLTVNGRLGLQVSNPDANTKLHIADTTNGFVGLRLSGSGDYTGTDWTIYASSLTAPSADDFLGFYNNSTTDGATSDYKVRMFKNGDVQVVNGNIVIGTSGKGIDFSATSNSSGTTSSELLNDYEEGTFTPTYTGTNLTVVSYGNQFGWYTKVGRLVTVTICLMTEDITVIGSENVKIGGLPFTSNSTSQAVNALVIGDSSRWATNPPKYGVLNNNSTEILLYRDSGATGAGTDPVTVKTDDMADATGNRNMIRATLTYFV